MMSLTPNDNNKNNNNDDDFDDTDDDIDDDHDDSDDDGFKEFLSFLCRNNTNIIIKESDRPSSAFDSVSDGEFVSMTDDDANDSALKRNGEETSDGSSENSDSFGNELVIDSTISSSERRDHEGGNFTCSVISSEHVLSSESKASNSNIFQTDIVVEETQLSLTECEKDTVNPMNLLSSNSQHGESHVYNHVGLNGLENVQTSLQISDDANSTQRSATEAFNYSHNPDAQVIAHDFAVEHRIFLRAILDMLAERDQRTLLADPNDPITIKIGSLKKASHKMKGLWKTKYIEVRKGIFSYFEDHVKRRSRNVRSTGRDQNLLRKDIPLLASSCTCRAVNSRNSATAIFELRVQGGSSNVWLATTKEEREAWIQAIHGAMIGVVSKYASLTEATTEPDGEKKSRSRMPLDTQYQSFFERHRKVKQAVRRAETKEEYLKALRYLSGKAINVPVQWLKQQFNGNAPNAFLDTGVSLSVEQLWKDLCRDSVKINEDIVPGDSFHGPDRIMGRLTHVILHCNGFNSSKFCITEAQAISYARDILLATNRTKSGGDSYYCVEDLCLNRNLVVICPTSTEATPLSITVSTDYESKIKSDSDYICGWVSTRSLSNKHWKQQYLILSRDILSCYAKAEPRPHELKEKLLLKGAMISNSSVVEKQAKKLIINIATKDKKQRDFQFDDESSYNLWRNALDDASLLHEKSSTKSYLSPLVDMIQQNSVEKASILSHSIGNPLGSQSCPLNVEINVLAEYKIVTVDPIGIESKDTWGTLRTTFIQNFHLSGGSHGRLLRGNEIVKVELL